MLSVMAYSLRCPLVPAGKGQGIWNSSIPTWLGGRDERVEEAGAVEGDPAVSGRPGPDRRRGRRRPRRRREQQLLHLHQCPAGEQLRVPERGLRRSLTGLTAA